MKALTTFPSHAPPPQTPHPFRQNRQNTGDSPSELDWNGRRTRTIRHLLRAKRSTDPEKKTSGKIVSHTSINVFRKEPPAISIPFAPVANAAVYSGNCGLSAVTKNITSGLYPALVLKQFPQFHEVFPQFHEARSDNIGNQLTYGSTIDTINVVENYVYTLELILSLSRFILIVFLRNFCDDL